MPPGSRSSRSGGRSRWAPASAGTPRSSARRRTSSWRTWPVGPATRSRFGSFLRYGLVVAVMSLAVSHGLRLRPLPDLGRRRCSASLTLPPPLGDLALAASQAPLDVMLGLFVLFVAAKIGEEVARRLGQPAVVGELLGGFIVGPGVLGLVVPGETAAVLAEIGVVILLFSVGLEVRLDDLLAVGRPAVLTAIIAMILPIAAGVAIGLGIGEELFPSLFIGLALAATSIGITSRVLAEMGVLDRTFARVVLGAAVIDDVLALILIGVVSGAATGDLSESTLFVGGRRRRVGRPRLRGGPSSARPQARGLHVAAVRRHAARAGVHPHVRCRARIRSDRPCRDHRRLRRWTDRRRDRGAGRARARDQATRADLHPVLLRGDRRPAGPERADRPEASPRWPSAWGSWVS